VPFEESGVERENRRQLRDILRGDLTEIAEARVGVITCRQAPFARNVNRRLGRRLCQRLQLIRLGRGRRASLRASSCESDEDNNRSEQANQHKQTEPYPPSSHSRVSRASVL
jgi:hypothetical protein